MKFRVKRLLLIAALTWSASHTAFADDFKCGKEKPRLEWVKKELARLFSSAEGKALNIEPEVQRLEEMGVHAVPGHFSSIEKIQQVVCIPGKIKKSNAGSSVKGNSHLLLLVECDSAGSFKTIATATGDAVYTETLIDADGDGFMEIPMVQITEGADGSKSVSYSLYSFVKMCKLYEANSSDYRAVLEKSSAIKNLKKGDLLYSILQIEYKDVNNDGKLELLEHWIEFRYNGGKNLRQIELMKSLHARTQILYLKEGFYASI